jgi:hypothetical protein
MRVVYWLMRFFDDRTSVGSERRIGGIVRPKMLLSVISAQLFEKPAQLPGFVLQKWRISFYLFCAFEKTQTKCAKRKRGLPMVAPASGE